MSCKFNRTKPCSTRTRDDNRYTRQDLESLAMVCGVSLTTPNGKRKTMDMLCAEIGRVRPASPRKPASPRGAKKPVGRPAKQRQTSPTFNPFLTQGQQFFTPGRAPQRPVGRPAKQRQASPRQASSRQPVGGPLLGRQLSPSGYSPTGSNASGKFSPRVSRQSSPRSLSSSNEFSSFNYPGQISPRVTSANGWAALPFARTSISSSANRSANRRSSEPDVGPQKPASRWGNWKFW